MKYFIFTGIIMKYQDFSSDKNLVSSEGNFLLSHLKISPLSRLLQYFINVFGYNKQNITCPPVDRNFNLLMFKSIFHSFIVLTCKISTLTQENTIHVIAFLPVCSQNLALFQMFAHREFSNTRSVWIEFLVLLSFCSLEQSYF